MKNKHENHVLIKNTNTPSERTKFEEHCVKIWHWEVCSIGFHLTFFGMQILWFFYKEIPSTFGDIPKNLLHIFLVGFLLEKNHFISAKITPLRSPTFRIPRIAPCFFIYHHFWIPKNKKLHERKNLFFSKENPTEKTTHKTFFSRRFPSGKYWSKHDKISHRDLPRVRIPRIAPLFFISFFHEEISQFALFHVKKDVFCCKAKPLSEKACSKETKISASLLHKRRYFLQHLIRLTNSWWKMSWLLCNTPSTFTPREFFLGSTPKAKKSIFNQTKHRKKYKSVKMNYCNPNPTRIILLFQKTCCGCLVVMSLYCKKKLILRPQASACLRFCQMAFFCGAALKTEIGNRSM